MANAFLQMITAATTLGLGAQYVTLLTSVVKEQEARTLLNIPDYMDIFDAAAIGHPGYVPRKKYVKPVENAIHYDTYDKSKSMTDKEIVERAKTHEDYKYID
jgi:nitroreductase